MGNVMDQSNRLTDEQKEALLAIGKPFGETAMVVQDVFDDLLRMGLMYKRSDCNYDLTKSGEITYKSLETSL